LEKLVFMDSGLGPAGRPGMTMLSVTLKLSHYLLANGFGIGADLL
jgi:hypothetical protein